MTRSRGLGLLAALLALTVVLAACGGDDGDSDGDEQEIIDAITFAATSGDPKACTEAQTARFTQQTSGEPGASPEEAVRSCEQEADTPAEEIEVSNVQVDDDTATAEGTITGGFFNGQTIEVGLVKEGDQWKLDELTRFVEFDRDALASGIREALAADAPPQAVDCVVGQVEQQSDEDLQQFLLTNDPEVEERIFGPCEKQFGGE
jgi:hypothetical protein